MRMHPMCPDLRSCLHLLYMGQCCKGGTSGSVQTRVGEHPDKIFPALVRCRLASDFVSDLGLRAHVQDASESSLASEMCPNSRFTDAPAVGRHPESLSGCVAERVRFCHREVCLDLLALLSAIFASSPEVWARPAEKCWQVGRLRGGSKRASWIPSGRGAPATRCERAHPASVVIVPALSSPA